MPGCSVPHCHRRADKGFRLFVFPKDHERRQLWTQLCNREDQPPPKHARMCEYHFDDNQFEKDFSGMRGKLKTNAIPTIFDTPITLRKVYVSVKSSSKKELLKINCVELNRSNGDEEAVIMNHSFDDIKPEFVDVSQQDDDSFWRNDLNVDSLHVEEQNFHQNDEHFEDLHASVEQLCVEPELPDDNLKCRIESERAFKSEHVENNHVQILINRSKVLEEQLRNKDRELKKTKRLLSKTLKQVETLKALNEQFQSNSKSCADRPKRNKRLRHSK